MDPKNKERKYSERSLNFLEMDKNSILNFNVIKKLKIYKKANSLTNEDLEEELTNIITDLFGESYINWWTASKVGKVLRGERSISSLEDRQTISYLLTEPPHSFSKLIFNNKKDIIRFLINLIDELKGNNKVINKTSVLLEDGYSGYVTGLTRIQKSKCTLTDFKVAIALESIRNNEEKGDIKQLYINSLNIIKSDLIDSKKININLDTINKFRAALPIEGSSLNEVQKVGYKFLIANLSGFSFL